MQLFKNRINKRLSKLSVATLWTLIAIPLWFKLLLLIIVMLNIYSSWEQHHAAAKIVLPVCEWSLSSDCGDYNLDLENCNKNYQAWSQCDINKETKTCEPILACLSCGDWAVVPWEQCDDWNLKDWDWCSSSCKLERLTDDSIKKNIENLKNWIKIEKDPLEKDRLSFCLWYLYYLNWDTYSANNIFKEVYSYNNMLVNDFPYLNYFAWMSSYLEEEKDLAREYWNQILYFIWDDLIYPWSEDGAFNLSFMPWYELIIYWDIYNDYIGNKWERLEEYNWEILSQGAYNICKTDYVFCGNWVIEEENKESCDDGNMIDWDGCNSSCIIEDWWICEWEPSECKDFVCGDWIRNYKEECDDGNLKNWDWCSASCEAEEGYICWDKCRLIECTDWWQIVSDEKHGNILEDKNIWHPNLISSDDWKTAYITYRDILDKEHNYWALWVKKYEDWNWYDIETKVEGHLKNIESVYNPYDKSLYILYKNNINLIELSVYNGSTRNTYVLFKEDIFFEPDIIISEKWWVFVSFYNSEKEDYLLFQFDAGHVNHKLSIPIYASANWDTLMKSVLKPWNNNELYYAITNINKKVGSRLLEIYRIDESFSNTKVWEFNIPDTDYWFDFEYDVENNLLHLVYQNDNRLLEYQLWNLQENSRKKIFSDMVVGIHDDVSIKYYDIDKIYVTTQSISDIYNIDGSIRKTIFLKINYKEWSILPLWDIAEIINYEPAVWEINIDSLQFLERLYRTFASKTDSESDPFLTFVCPQDLSCAWILPNNTIHTQTSYIYNWYGIENLQDIKPVERGYNEFLNGDCNFYCDTWFTRNWSICEPNSCEFNGQIIPHLWGVIAYQSGVVEYGSSCVSEIRVCGYWELNWSYQNTWCIVAEPNNCVFNWNIIPHWESVTTYSSDFVSCGWSCLSELRTCNNWVLGGTFWYSSCRVGSCWGWWSTISRDDCCEDSNLPWANQECEDHSSSYYDRTCEGEESFESTENIENSHYFEEIDLDTTSHNSSNTELTRILAAEMIYQVALELWIEHDYKQECYDFKDLKNYSSKKYFAIQACLYGYMWYEQDGLMVAENFNPDRHVTRAQILTILSRLLYWWKYNLESLEWIDTSKENYWSFNHAKALNDAGIVNEISAYRLSKNETVDYFSIMIDRTIKMLWKEDEIRHYSSDSSIVNALEGLYEDLNPSKSEKEYRINKLQSLLGDSYNSTFFKEHNTSNDLSGSNVSKDIRSTLIDFVNEIRPDNKEESSTNLWPKERIEELIKNN